MKGTTTIKQYSHKVAYSAVGKQCIRCTYNRTPGNTDNTDYHSKPTVIVMFLKNVVLVCYFLVRCSTKLTSDSCCICPWPDFLKIGPDELCFTGSF